MSVELCALLIIGSVLFGIYVLRKIRYSKFKIDDSIFWICFSFILILISIFPGVLTVGAKKLGVISPVNFSMSPPCHAISFTAFKNFSFIQKSIGIGR